MNPEGKDWTVLWEARLTGSEVYSSDVCLLEWLAWQATRGFEKER